MLRNKLPAGVFLERVQKGEILLEDLIGKGAYVAAFEDARWRIIRVFVQARSEKGRRATSGRLVGLDEHITSLACYLESHMHRRMQDKILAIGDLLPVCHGYTQELQYHLVVRVRFEIYMRLLLQMREASELWYMNGEWMIPPSVGDEYLRRYRAARQNYQNSSHWHGRPNTQRRRFRGLGMAPGTSTGLAS